MNEANAARTPLLVAWRTYREHVIPRDASAVQVMETRRAFYGGAWSFLTALLTIDEDTPDEAGVAMLEVLKAEIQSFEELVKAGRA
jgi:hypothetical protein